MTQLVVRGRGDVFVVSDQPELTQVTQLTDGVRILVESDQTELTQLTLCGEELFGRVRSLINDANDTIDRGGWE